MQVMSPKTATAFQPRAYQRRRSPSQLVPGSSDDVFDAIYVVDADPELRADISGCLDALDNAVVQCASGAEYLGRCEADAGACVILNICLPDMHGLDLQRKIIENGNPPVIFIGEDCDIASTVRAMKAGALDFHPKPIDLAALYTSVRTALAQTRKTRHKKAEVRQLQKRFDLLTPREREALQLIIGGLLNKQAASILGISEVTLQIHRSQVMRKMQADSLPDLVRMAVKLHIPYWHDGRIGLVERPTAASAIA